MANFYNESGLEFTDIGSELSRTYHFPNGEELTINEPEHLHVSESGGHRVFDASGTSWYVRPGWLWLKWQVREGAPNFVK